MTDQTFTDRLDLIESKTSFLTKYWEMNSVHYMQVDANCKKKIN